MSDALARPPLGRRFALELRATSPLTWIGPLAAAACGLVSAGMLTLTDRAVLNALLALLLVDPLLGAWRALWVQTDWRAPLRIQPQPRGGGQLVPFAQQGSPAARLASWWSYRIAFWGQAVWPELAHILSGLWVVGLLSLAVAVVLGPEVILLVGLALLLGPLESEMGAHAGAWLRAAAEMGIPWLVGWAALAQQFSWPAICLACFLSVSYRGLVATTLQTPRQFAWINLGLLGVAGVLAWEGHSLSMGLVALLAIAQTLWQAYMRLVPGEGAAYLLRVQWLFLMSMVLAALGL